MEDDDKPVGRVLSRRRALAGTQCKPLPGATVDIWHCDAAGVYSDIAAEGTTGKNYLRGYQLSNRGGIVRFTTILPGWYERRTAHTHVKIRTTGTDGTPPTGTPPTATPSA